MSQPYRVNLPGGVKVEATGQIIYPGMPEWELYEAWLAEQPGPSVPGGPVPAGTGMLPFIAPVMTLAEQRAEMLARLDALVTLKRTTGTVNALGHTWALTDSFCLGLALHGILFPPIPAGFSLPNSARVLVAINNDAQFTDLVSAVNTRLIAVRANFAALAAAINASATPLAINLDAGWPA